MTHYPINGPCKLLRLSRQHAESSRRELETAILVSTVKESRVTITDYEAGLCWLTRSTVLLNGSRFCTRA